MKYQHGNRVINIPDKDIEKLMKTLDLSQIEAVETWLVDNDFEEDETVEELTEKAKTIRRYEKSDKERKKSTRERKVDEEKKILLYAMRDLMELHGGEIKSVKNEAEFTFFFGENTYTVKLVKHRPPKK